MSYVPPTITLTCGKCLIPFEKHRKEYDRQVRKGRTLFFCSIRCAKAHAGKTKALVEDRVCPVCGTEFTTPIGVKREKTTCSVLCGLKHFRRGRNKPELMTRHKAICFYYHAKQCAICSEQLIVEVHHLDEDHTNNAPENLVPLCPTHHQYWHSKHRHLVEVGVRAYAERFKNGGDQR